MKTTLLKTLFVGLLGLSGAAQASLVMSIYSGAGYGGVAGVKSAIAGGAPTATTTATVVDYWDGSGGAGSYGNNFAFPAGLVDNFGVQFTGYLNVAASGIYDFRSLADDGVELAIDGTTLFSDASYHPPAYVAGSAFLTAGQHSISFIYFEGGGGATVELEGRASGGSYTLLGTSAALQTGTVNNANANDVPEPTTLALVGLALAAGGLVSRRR